MVDWKSWVIKDLVRLQNRFAASSKRRIVSVLLLSFFCITTMYFLLDSYDESIKETFSKIWHESKLSSNQNRIELSIKAVKACIEATNVKDDQSSFYCDFAIQRYSDNYSDIFKDQKNDVINRKAYYKMLLDLESELSFVGYKAKASEEDKEEQLVENDIVEALNLLRSPDGYLIMYLAVLILYIFSLLFIFGFIKIKPTNLSRQSKFQQRQNMK